MSGITFDPQKVNLVVKGVAITGFAEGTMIEIERNEDAIIPYVQREPCSCSKRRIFQRNIIRWQKHRRMRWMFLESAGMFNGPL